MVIFIKFLISVIIYYVIIHSTTLVFYNKKSSWSLLDELNFEDDSLKSLFLFHFTVVMISINYLSNIYQKS